jgi:hypothetical protein
MTNQQLNIAVAERIGFSIIDTEFSDVIKVLGKDGDFLFGLNDPACLNMACEHFRINVNEMSATEWVATKHKTKFQFISAVNKSRNQAIIECLRKIVESEDE